MKIGPRGRASVLATALVVALTLVLGLLSGAPAHAAPDEDDEGGTVALRNALDAASQGFIDAQNALEHSRQRQTELTAQLAATNEQMVKLQGEVDEIVALTYRTGRLWMAASVLDSGSPAGFTERVTTVSLVAARQDKQIRNLALTREKLTAEKQALDAEIVNQETQVKVMAQKKTDAERALAEAGTGEPADGPDKDADAQPAAGPQPKTKAAPAPRRGNGALGPESCSVNDPTTSGCITPRLLHALQQAQGAGFNHFVSCFRPGRGDPGEHPKGRACDFAAAARSFGGVAGGADKAYGTNLANYFIANASALGVLYVIWFKRIWLPSSGWRAYTRGRGDPSSDHTNHVHLSVR